MRTKPNLFLCLLFFIPFAAFYSFCAGGAEDIMLYIFFFLVLIALFYSPVFAATETTFDCGGYLRAGFIHTKIRHLETQTANALAAKLACDYRLNSHIKAFIGTYGVVDTGLNPNKDNNVHGEFFNSYKDSYLILGEAALVLNYQNFELSLGRQPIESPHMDSDDLRMVPNLFEAYLGKYSLNDSMQLGIGFIRQASGWANGVNQSHFVAIGEAFGGKNSGAWVSWAEYEQAIISTKAWFYFIPNHLTLVYSEFLFKGDLTDDISYDLGVQYEWGHSIGSEKIDVVNNHTLGIMGAISIQNFTLTATYNKNIGDSSAIASLGAGPFFTALEDQTLDAVEGKNAHAFSLALEYEIHSSLTLGVAAGEFKAQQTQQYKTQEINYFLNYHWNAAFSAEIIYATIDDRNSPEEMNQFRAILTYQY
jgi:hypothetical protein